MEPSTIIELILGGGLVAAITGIITLRQTLRKARAEADNAHADVETVKLTNTEHATKILMDMIVKPLKDDLHETRKDLNSTKREMARLRKAIDEANSCKYSDTCPVLDRMRRDKKRAEQDADDPAASDGDTDGADKANSRHCTAEGCSDAEDTQN